MLEVSASAPRSRTVQASGCVSVAQVDGRIQSNATQNGIETPERSRGQGRLQHEPTRERAKEGRRRMADQPDSDSRRSQRYKILRFKDPSITNYLVLPDPRLVACFATWLLRAREPAVAREQRELLPDGESVYDVKNTTKVNENLYVYRAVAWSIL